MTARRIVADLLAMAVCFAIAVVLVLPAHPDALSTVAAWVLSFNGGRRAIAVYHHIYGPRS